ncbi:phosphatidylserine decarboxylase family protein [Flagellimonas hymeniacidonis]|uniref:Phosphatidylserine decarboxylase proenzyme n=1 Tax=Flagellimonas hymeniacidonis TaxID=2603628 RepID=A0A5C8V5W4_9FLAO|nr:phosphatidylserine decarboxylase family protein [Flagellimonas hymeniacidonis]TXN36766.1 phosphatidylserine decarboxylase family protein [Flagellimonas hymeniacidonis]
MFHKEGQKIIITTFFIVVAIVLAAHFYVDLAWLRISIQVLALILLILILQFFRNPKRLVTPNFDEVLAPVDGKVVVIEEVEESEYFKDKRKQVSIFMSPLNVHVTRYAVSGTVTYSKYHPGKYLVAWHPKSSTENERTTVVLHTPKFGEIGYRQIAGALARRIVNYAEEGEQVAQGQDAGFIKFGSRVDLFLPLDCDIAVKLNQKVVGAKTCIASFRKQDD